MGCPGCHVPAVFRVTQPATPPDAYCCGSLQGVDAGVVWCCWPCKAGTFCTWSCARGADACLCWVTQAADAVHRCCLAVLEGAKAGRVPSEGLTNAFGMFLQNELSFAGTASLDSSWEEERRAQAACELLLCLPEWRAALPRLRVAAGHLQLPCPHAALHVACTDVLSPGKSAGRAHKRPTGMHRMHRVPILPSIKLANPPFAAGCHAVAGSNTLSQQSWSMNKPLVTPALQSCR